MKIRFALGCLLVILAAANARAADDNKHAPKKGAKVPAGSATATPSAPSSTTAPAPSSAIPPASSYTTAPGASVINREGTVRSPSYLTSPAQRYLQGTRMDRANVQVPSRECPGIKARFDAALDWAMKGARPDVCDFTMWDAGCNNLFSAVGSCNANNCAEKCHQQDTIVIDITQCGNKIAFKQLVNSYAGMSQESRDACMAQLRRQGL